MALRVLRSGDLAEGQRVSLVSALACMTRPYDQARVLRPPLPHACEGLQVCAYPVCLLQAVHGRTVTVLRHRGKVVCLDALCYHMGEHPVQHRKRTLIRKVTGCDALSTAAFQGVLWETRVTSRTCQPLTAPA